MLRKGIEISQNKKFIKEVLFDKGSILHIEHEPSDEVECSYSFDYEDNLSNIRHVIKFYENNILCSTLTILDDSIDFLVKTGNDSNSSKGYAVCWMDKDPVTLWSIS